jgi:methylenetetrahydrofolate dehydrogenase (NADP+)/methenyltetrahydrofolate cyclohydrolase
LNDDVSVNGIIIERPLPESIDFHALTLALSPLKDVDSVTPFNMGSIVLDFGDIRPATAAACLRIMDYYGIKTQGKHVVIVGRSPSVGLPLANMLLSKGRDATVTVCHSKTNNLKRITKEADILISAIGRAHFINHEYVGQNAVIIDVGTNYTEDGLKGDVDFDSVKDIVSAITPVPGGVGPVTSAVLLENAVLLALNI